MKFEPKVLREAVRVATKNGIEPAALLAVVEVESAGRALEDDGRTPRLLFERHVFYRELKKRQPGKLQQAIDAGLAIPKWSRATQYKDLGTSRNRLAVFARARAIDEECAVRSCSWGVGQTMGFLAEEQGFQDAPAMLAFMVKGGVPAQIECMVREITRKHLTDELERHDWAGFAKVYNGPGYKQNQYDTKMAAAWARWLQQLKAELPPVDVEDATPAPMPPMENEPIDIPPTRNSEAKPVTKSKTAWSVGGILASVAGTVGGIFSNANNVALICLTVILILALFIFRERIKKLVEEHV